MMVIGGIIGSGIFRNPQVVAQRVHTPGLTLGTWVLGGAIALIGAFVYGELGARFPRAGGGYVYIRDAYGTLPAFLYAWALLLMVATGAIAAVAVTFANYFIALTGLTISPNLLAGLAIVVLSASRLEAPPESGLREGPSSPVGAAPAGVLPVRSTDSLGRLFPGAPALNR